MGRCGGAAFSEVYDSPGIGREAKGRSEAR